MKRSVRVREEKRAAALARRYQIDEIERRTGHAIPSLAHALRRDYMVMRTIARAGEIRTDHIEITHYSEVGVRSAGENRLRVAGDAPPRKMARRAFLASRSRNRRIWGK